MAKLEWHGDKAAKKMDAALAQALKASALLVEGQAKNLCPVGQYETGQVGGNLRNSITHEVGKREARVGTNVEYGKFVELGTAPHTITVKDKRVLTDGKNFFGKTVRHPGTAPQPFLVPSLEMNKANIRKLIAEAVKGAVGD